MVNKGINYYTTTSFSHVNMLNVKGVIEDDLHILFCYKGAIKPGETFQQNTPGIFAREIAIFACTLIQRLFHEKYPIM